MYSIDSLCCLPFAFKKPLDGLGGTGKLTNLLWIKKFFVVN